MDVYKRLKILEDIVDRILEFCEKEGIDVAIVPEYRVSFYEDERKMGVQVNIELSEDSTLIPMLSTLEKIREIAGADDMFVEISEGDYVKKIELYFEEKVMEDEDKDRQ